MSAVRKLVIASALVATGLGVAFLLGKPGGIPKIFHPAITPASDPVPASATAASERKIETASSPIHAQLLPEPANSPAAAASALEPPALISSLVPVATPNDEPARGDTKVVATNDNSFASHPFESNTPTAKLRNEAPRAMGNEPRSVAVIRRLPPVENVSGAVAANSFDRVNTANTNGLPFQAVPTNFASEPNAPPATVASFNSPLGSQQSVVSPAAWPVNDDAREPRTHVVVDGDSLEKLAGRYLDDPQRGREIYELNRDVLANPDLLPIGAELRIPERVARSSWNRQGFRPAAVDDATIRSAANSNLVPIRSATAADPYDVAAPQAQLAHPIAVE